MSCRKVTLVDRQCDTVQAVEIKQRTADFNFSEHLEIRQCLLKNNFSCIGNPDLDPISGAQFKALKNRAVYIGPDVAVLGIEYFDITQYFAVTENRFLVGYLNNLGGEFTADLFKRNDPGRQPGACVGINIPTMKGV